MLAVKEANYSLESQVSGFLVMILVRIFYIFMSCCLSSPRLNPSHSNEETSAVLDSAVDYYLLICSMDSSPT